MPAPFAPRSKKNIFFVHCLYISALSSYFEKKISQKAKKQKAHTLFASTADHKKFPKQPDSQPIKKNSPRVSIKNSNFSNSSNCSSVTYHKNNAITLPAPSHSFFLVSRPKSVLDSPRDGTNAHWA